MEDIAQVEIKFLLKILRSVNLDAGTSGRVPGQTVFEWTRAQASEPIEVALQNDLPASVVIDLKQRPRQIQSEERQRVKPLSLQFRGQDGRIRQ